MKRLFLIGLFLLLAMAACHTPTREAKRMAARAKALAETAPDSTVWLIDSVLHMPIYFNERQRMDMALLQAEALFGRVTLDDDLSETMNRVATSPELERACEYYAKKKQYAKAAHAALYSGYVQQHYDEKETAMRSYKAAEQYGLLTNDSLTAARAQYWMGNLMFDEYMEEAALSLFKSADIGLGNHYAERASAKNMEAVTYIVLKRFDEAEQCLMQSFEYAEIAQSTEAKLKTLNNYAVFYRLQGEYDQAIDCLRQAKKVSKSSKLFQHYLNMGKTFSAMHELDSASFYYQRIEDLLPTTEIRNEIKVSAYGALSHFAESQNNDSLALKYRIVHESLLYEEMRQHQEQAVFRIQQQYDYESLQNSLNRKIILRHRIILIISILLFASAILILVLQYRHKQLIAAEAELQQQIDAMKQDLRQTVKSAVMDEEVAARLRMMLTATRAQQRGKDPNNEWLPLVRQVMNGKDSLFEAARSAIETAYPNLYALIKEEHPNLSDTEAKVCLLSFCDLSNAEIAKLLGLSLNTVNQNRSTLRKKLNLKPDRMKEQLRYVLSESN